MFKKSITVLIIFLTMLLAPLLVSAHTPVSVTINGVPLSFDVPPTIIEGRTLVPLRAIFEALGATVSWDNETRTVTATKADTTIILITDSKNAFRNGQLIVLDVPSRIINGRTMVPGRFVGESLGATVSWEQDTRTVTILKQEEFEVACIVTLVREDLARELNTSIEDIKVVSIENVTWNDASLGVPGGMAAQVITEGHIVILEYGNIEYVYHTDLRHSFVRIRGEATSNNFTTQGIKNAKIRTMFSQRWVQLNDGYFWDETWCNEIDFWDRIMVQMEEPIIFGDLDFDGKQEAVAVIYVNYGGTGVFAQLTVFKNQNNNPVYLTSIELGDRIVINDIDIKAGRVILDMIVHGEDDPMALPTERIIKEFMVIDHRLVNVTLKVDETSQVDEKQEELSTEDIVEMARPATVFIRTADSTGSGFIVESNGKIITNHHVIEGSSWIEVVLLDGRTFKAMGIYYHNKDRDIAILNIEGSNLPTLNLGNSDMVRAGQDVIVIGSPLGLVDTVTKGIISNAARVINGQVSIQLDAAVSGGNSGGPVLNNRGEVIGVMFAEMRDKETLNFAIPINDVIPNLTKNWNLSLSEFAGGSRTPDTHETTIVEPIELTCGSIYSGEMRNNRPHGWGTLWELDGGVYMGQWREGRLHGMVWSMWEDEVRIGTWHEGKTVGIEGWFTRKGLSILGNCEFIQFSNAWYRGEVRNGAPHGWGNMRWDNGDWFFGEWQNGSRCGIGVVIFKESGNRFIGKWDLGEMTEHGVWFNKDGTLR